MEPTNPEQSNQENLQPEKQSQKEPEITPLKKSLLILRNITIGILGLIVVVLSIFSMIQYRQDSNKARLAERKAQKAQKTLPDGRVFSNTVPVIAYYEDTTRTGLEAEEYSRANNAKRRADVTQILNAIVAFRVDREWTPPQIPMTPREIATNGVDLCIALVGNYTNYAPMLPIDTLKIDPNVVKDSSVPVVKDCNIPYETGYTVFKDADEKVTVAAPLAELGETISETR